MEGNTVDERTLCVTCGCPHCLILGRVVTPKENTHGHQQPLPFSLPRPLAPAVHSVSGDLLYFTFPRGSRAACALLCPAVLTAASSRRSLPSRDQHSFLCHQPMAHICLFINGWAISLLALFDCHWPCCEHPHSGLWVDAHFLFSGVHVTFNF